MGVASLTQSIEETAAGFSGRFGLWAHNLETGEELAIRADEIFSTASVIKLPVMYEVFRQAGLGRLSLDETLTLDRPNMVTGSGILKELDEGHRLTVREAVTLMIIVSDNSATNLCIDRVGGWDAVNAGLDDLGFKHTRLNKKVFIPNPAAPGAGLGDTTPREMGTLLLRIARRELLTPPACDQMLDILGRQQFKEPLVRDIEEFNDDAPADSPVSLRLASKGGAVEGVRNEVGLFATRRGRYVLSVFTNGSRDLRFHPNNEGVVLIGRVSRLVYDAWGRGESRPGPPVRPRRPAPGY